jgi:hypothetical protein
MPVSWFLRFAVALLLLCAPASGAAHEVGLSRGDYAAHAAHGAHGEHAAQGAHGESAAQGARVAATLTFARRDVDPADAGWFADELRVRGDGVRCPAKVVSAAPFETDGVRVVVEAICASSSRRIEIEALFLARLPFGHRHLAHLLADDAPGVAGSDGPSVAGSGGPSVTGSGMQAQVPSDVVLTVGNRTFSFAPSAPAREPRRSLLWLGAEHILLGVDHLVFLLGLVLVLTRVRDALLAVTAFTVGHSLSLALSALGVFVPSPRWVEPLIALSIAWVGLENLRASSPADVETRRVSSPADVESRRVSSPADVETRRASSAAVRVRIALPFGLVHGFGFASALHELGLPRVELPLALAAFNLGVELGQLGVLLPAWSALRLVSKRAWYAHAVVRPVSFAVVVAGALWFVARVLA